MSLWATEFARALLCRTALEEMRVSPSPPILSEPSLYETGFVRFPVCGRNRSETGNCAASNFAGRIYEATIYEAKKGADRRDDGSP